ncbi:hypothetical protein DFJ58DRAFT_720608 [Suillus subalutaceus]|uniref:uncharacterized protein n=1 Tax=Suillus subalutaceus TaxID=48586 RepID=UPI001B870204|nr:uncharacterized protein DFJ58DRAFT_720608 [Suillus subalutaceus]KAG1877845.1 hypothetical protein DFJ58DRAFT_720608 [Suillus subalutaceus]
MEIFYLYALLTSHGAPLVNAMHAKEDEVATTNPALSWVSQVLPDEVALVCGPRPVCNHFLKGILSGDAQTAFQVNVTPDYRSLSPAEICIKYTLPNFDHALTDFIAQSSPSSGEHTCWDPKYGRYQVWNKFWLQLHSAFQQRVIMPSRVVQAYPPSNNFPLGDCDTVLIDAMGINGKMIVRQGSNLELPSYLSGPLLYIELFCFISSPDDCPELTMWTIERTYMQDQNDIPSDGFPSADIACRYYASGDTITTSQHLHKSRAAQLIAIVLVDVYNNSILVEDYIPIGYSMDGNYYALLRSIAMGIDRGSFDLEPLKWPSKPVGAFTDRMNTKQHQVLLPLAAYMKLMKDMALLALKDGENANDLLAQLDNDHAYLISFLGADNEAHPMFAYFN